MDAELVIVGAGPAGTHVLTALAERPRAPHTPSRVVVLERAARCGPGLPWGDAADAAHTYGRIARLRREKGVALEAQFERSVERLRGAGVEVEVRTETSALQAQRDGTGVIVRTPGGDVRAARMVVASGHWHTSRLSHLSRAVDWRWDVRRLHAAVLDHEDVLVLGTSQSAVDIALALGARRASVSSPGRVLLASRRGLLPSVWGPLRGSRVPPGGAKRLDRLRGRASVRLADIEEALRTDLAALGASMCDVPTDPAYPETPHDGIATIRADAAAAEAAFRDGREIPWQSVLWPTVPAVFELYPKLCAEDRLALAPRWSQALRYLEAIHLDAAERILALADDGRLSVHALGPEITLREDPSGVWARGAFGELRADHVIDARGHDPAADRCDDAFVRSLLAEGIACEARVPFVSPPSPALDRSGSIASCQGRAHLLTGGLWIDPQTFQLRDVEGLATASFALGPLTLGQLPVYLGLWGLRAAAARIAGQLTV